MFYWLIGTSEWREIWSSGEEINNLNYEGAKTMIFSETREHLFFLFVLSVIPWRRKCSIRAYFGYFIWQCFIVKDENCFCFLKKKKEGSCTYASITMLKKPLLIELTSYLTSGTLFHGLNNVLGLTDPLVFTGFVGNFICTFGWFLFDRKFDLWCLFWICNLPICKDVGTVIHVFLPFEFLMQGDSWKSCSLSLEDLYSKYLNNRYVDK